MREIIVKKENITNLSITLYENNEAVISDQRVVNSDQDSNIIKLYDVSKKIIKRSLLIEGLNIDKVEFVEKGFDEKDVLKHFVGKTVFIIDNIKGDKMEYDFLAYNNDEVILRVKETNEIVLKNKMEIIYPPIENMYFDSFIKIDKKNETKDSIKLFYTTKGINWESNYIIKLNDENYCTVLNTLSIENTTEVSYENVKLKLAIKDILDSKDKDLKDKEIDYNNQIIFDINTKENINIDLNSIVNIFNSDEIKYKMFCYFSGNDNKLRKFLEIKDEIKNLFLPGEVKIYDNQNHEIFLIGQSFYEGYDTEKVIIDLGEVEGVYCKLTEIEIKKFRNHETIEVEFRIENYKSEKVNLKIPYSIDGVWGMIKTSEEYDKYSVNKIIYNVSLESNTVKKINFKYKIMK